MIIIQIDGLPENIKNDIREELEAELLHSIKFRIILNTFTATDENSKPAIVAQIKIDKNEILEGIEITKVAYVIKKHNPKITTVTLEEMTVLL